MAEVEARGARGVRWVWLGRAPYAQVLSVQERIRDGVIRGTDSETLLLVEHPTVITLGRNADPANVLASPRDLEERGIRVLRVSRGGDVTVHGPGQLVGYPVFRVRDGVRAHVTAMGAAVVAVLAELGIFADWRPSHPGIWLGEKKICAVGVHVRRGVAMHGFALNVNVDLALFATIIPCGLRGFGVTSIAEVLGAAPSLDELVQKTVGGFEHSFGVRMERISVSDSRLQIAIEDL
jgi:lipoyl(octanoyl) transferase